jgi:Transcriptional regulator
VAQTCANLFELRELRLAGGRHDLAHRIGDVFQRVIKNRPAARTEIDGVETMIVGPGLAVEQTGKFQSHQNLDRRVTWKSELCRKIGSGSGGVALRKKREDVKTLLGEIALDKCLTQRHLHGGVRFQQRQQTMARTHFFRRMAPLREAEGFGDETMWERRVHPRTLMETAEKLNDFVVFEVITFRYHSVFMELRHLRYFVAVAEVLSFRRAAERLRVAQPALSKQIKDLEEEIGTRLLDRNTAGVLLTDAGQLFFDEARAILERVDRAVNAAREAEKGDRGRLTIGALGPISSSFLPPALAAFSRQYPEVDVMLHETRLAEQVNALKAGRLQLGFALGSELPNARELESMPVLESRIALVLAPHHPLARQTAVSLKALQNERLICVEESSRDDGHRRKIQAIFESRELSHGPIKRVNSFESLVALVAGNHGVSFFPPIARGTDEVAYRRLKEDGPDLHVSLSAIWRRGSGSQLARNFVEVLRSLRLARRQAG